MPITVELNVFGRDTSSLGLCILVDRLSVDSSETSIMGTRWIRWTIEEENGIAK